MDLIVAIRAFASVAKHGSYSAAAREIGLSRSAVSRYVIELENKLGVRLINRTTRKLHLTDFGQEYLERSAAIVEQLEDLNANMNMARAVPRGKLKVTAPTLYGELQVLPVVSKYLGAYPDASVDLHLSSEFVDIIKGGFDLAIRVAETLSDSSLVSRRIATWEFVICASPGYCEQFGAPKQPMDLSEHQCILSAGAAAGVTWEMRSDDGAHFSVPILSRLSLSGGRPMLEAVQRDLGIALLPECLASEPIAQGELVRLLDGYKLDAYPVYAVFPHRRNLAAKTRAFVDMLVEELR